MAATPCCFDKMGRRSNLLRPSFLLLWLLPLFLICASRAQAADLECKIYFAGDIALPPEAKSILLKAGEPAIEYCRATDGGADSYWTISDIQTVFPNVCEFEKTRVGGPQTTYGTVSTLMRRKTGPECPKQDDGYVGVDEVSPGLFVMLSDAWSKLQSSAASFDAASSNIPLQDKKSEWFPPLRQYFLKKKPILSSVSLNKESRIDGRTGYELQGPFEGTQAVILDGDITPAGFEVFRLGLLVQ